MQKAGYENRFVPGRAVESLGNGNALVIAPHPDDEIAGCAGALINHVKNNNFVQVRIVTDGRFGDPAVCLKKNKALTEEYIKTRQKESILAARYIGYSPPEFLGYCDRSLVYGDSLIRDIKKMIDGIDVQFVYAPSPFEMHPDHRAVAFSSMEAVNQCTRDVSLFLYEIGRPIPTPDILLDITRVSDIKRNAFRIFQSQLEVRAYDEYIQALNRFRAYTLPDSVEKAEAYMKISKGSIVENAYHHAAATEFMSLEAGPVDNSEPSGLSGQAAMSSVEKLSRMSAGLADCQADLRESRQMLSRINNSLGFRSYLWITKPVRFLKNRLFTKRNRSL